MVEFPDLPGCVTEGNRLSDVINIATDAAFGWGLTELEDRNKAPKESNIETAKVPKGSFISFVELDIDS